VGGGFTSFNGIGRNRIARLFGDCMVDAGITNDGATIAATTAGAEYQWVDCNDNNEPIIGETAQSFMPTINGNYAVIVTENGCAAMSPCENYITAGISGINAQTGFIIYPNPNSGTFRLAVSSPMLVNIYNSTGKLIYSDKINAGSKNISLENYSSGMYMIFGVTDKGDRISQRVIVTK
jgi:hypothetical protein